MDTRVTPQTPGPGPSPGAPPEDEAATTDVAQADAPLGFRLAKFGIGQVVKHRIFAFRGVIFDVDPVFANTEEWWEAIPEEVRPRKDQPFYHLLAENESSYYVAYVSQQNLLAPGRHRRAGRQPVDLADLRQLLPRPLPPAPRGSRTRRVLEVLPPAHFDLRVAALSGDAWRITESDFCTRHSMPPVGPVGLPATSM